MYWGEGICFAATSDDLITWQPLEFDGAPERFLSFVPNIGHGAWENHALEGQNSLCPMLFPRAGRFNSRLVEPGPPAILTDDGVILICNGANGAEDGDPTLPPQSYTLGQVLFDLNDPASVVARPNEPFLRPTQDEARGQFNNVCFAQGLVLFGGKWRLYFGMADSQIGSATAPQNP